MKSKILNAILEIITLFIYAIRWLRDPVAANKWLREIEESRKHQNLNQ